MKIVEMVMPPMGESIMECTVLNLLKKTGETVSADDSVLEVATDKVDTEVPCPFNGKLTEWLVKENDVVAIGSVVAHFEVEDDVPASDKQPAAPETQEEIPDAETMAAMLENDFLKAVDKTPEPVSDHVKNDLQGNIFYSPLVLSIAREENISASELAGIPGTGAENRVTKNDIFAFISNRKSTPVKPAPSAAVSLNGSNEIIEMDRMRKMISQRMVESKRISAHVTSFIETDMTPIVNWREQVKTEFRKQTGDSITFTPILIEAVAKAIRDFPMINISVDGEKIIRKNDINIGMAVALPDGNLIVPVIHHADQYDLPGLARKVNELARRARENKLKADDLAGGTYSVSNIGAFSNLMGTPVIVQPQVAIMAFGAIKKKPAVLETPQGDLIGIRSMMFISHSYDHRVVDGSLGGMFLKRVNDYLENFDIHRSLI
ncbi:dihydrolipoamide acetyltransferase family protein [Dyadobacter sediminis]|uniref:Dihydrolipoamide acetyltransferase component of pyruvate dehydrogenase complex n=1 Tax=Dyadobacter sediminis TaxID=1493691 RepID=A0A5R9KKE7_9BACT|nr:dihydrolipoamide acetyltransferase family protein [Dyadobacter sediminis]TLU96692.1 2-oxo acid dehydrogenase subunit E2 [Dyadobacter sediminis]GGB84371.1 dihydrolipoamide acetyltransferase component of pyruvate dehydrogenase complex [Dyadobacter sediminis]